MCGLQKFSNQDKGGFIHFAIYIKSSLISCRIKAWALNTACKGVGPLVVHF